MMDVIVKLAEADATKISKRKGRILFIILLKNKKRVRIEKITHLV